MLLCLSIACTAVLCHRLTLLARCLGTCRLGCLSPAATQGTCISFTSGPHLGMLQLLQTQVRGRAHAVLLCSSTNARPHGLTAMPTASWTLQGHHSALLLPSHRLTQLRAISTCDVPALACLQAGSASYLPCPCWQIQRNPLAPK
jgi:hypothetical protein